MKGIEREKADSSGVGRDRQWDGVGDGGGEIEPKKREIMDMDNSVCDGGSGLGVGGRSHRGDKW